MNDFLSRIKNILINNPHLMNDDLKGFIYTQLISYNLGKGEPFKNMEELFDDWIFRNRNKENLQTFVSDKYPYFCQFANKGAVNITDKAIKLYIPIDEHHLYEGANKLFDFIEKENIYHNSKIGKKIRNDNVIVRVSNIDEAEKVINFVKNDPYIQDGLMNINPFTINVDGVGLAKDGFYSYNVELCTSIARFVNILNSRDRLDDLNVNTFHEYLEQTKNFGDKDLQMINSLQREVTSGKKLNFDDFKSIINGTYDKNNEVNKEEIFKDVVSATYNKYGLKHTINAVARYRYNGSDSGFTRDNGKRYELTINKITREDVNNYLANFNKESDNVIEDYINRIVLVNKDEFSYVVDAYMETLNKYDKGQADIAITHYIMNGETKYLTNNNNARSNIIDYVNHSKIYDILREGLDIDAYCTIEELCDVFIEEMSINYSKHF